MCDGVLFYFLHLWKLTDNFDSPFQKTSATVAELSLSFCELLPDLTEMEQGGEKVYCFTMCERGLNSFVFGTKTPEERDGWFGVLYGMLASRKKLVRFYFLVSCESRLIYVGGLFCFFRIIYMIN